MKNIKYTLLWVGIFALAMGFLESAVVVYLRKMYYPDGFRFPITGIEPHIAITEILREAATVIMLLSIGFLVTKKASERLAYFIYSFAIWDIFYYVFLYLLLGWPKTLLDWDILFLIPITWFGPVITPVLLALMMISLAVLIIYFNQKMEKVRIKWKEWLLLISGSLICIFSFTKEYLNFLMNEHSFVELLNTPQKELISRSLQFMPEVFPWWIYWVGFVTISAGVALFWFRNSKNVKKLKPAKNNIY